MPLKTLHVGAPLESANLLLVLLHGRAAPRNDLEDFALQVIERLNDRSSERTMQVAALLPEGPFAEGIGRGWWEFPPDMDRGDVASWIPPDCLVQDLVATVRNALASCERPPALIIGGFSIGSALATYSLAALGAQGVGVVGLVVLSGFLNSVALAEGAEYMPVLGKGPLHLFVAHGQDDMLIPETVAQSAMQRVDEISAGTSRGIDLQAYLHGGGHDLGDGTEKAMSQWMARVYDTLLQKPAGCESHRMSNQNEKQRMKVKPKGFSAMLAERASQQPSVALDPKSHTAPTHNGKQTYADGDIVKLAGVPEFPNLEGARAVVVKWHSDLQLWEVQVMTTQEVVYVNTVNMKDHVTNHKEVDAGDSPITHDELLELREMQIESVYDHPDLLSCVWGSSNVCVPTGCEQARLGGVPCLVFGRQPMAPMGVPTVLLFQGNMDLSSTPIDQIANAYVSIGAQAVVPFCARKLSECLNSARAVASALPQALGVSQPLLVHGIGAGSIMAVQIAAEQSQPGALPRVRLLVLENAVPSLSWIPRVQSLLGCMSVDPLEQQYKLRKARCPVLLVRGFAGELPKIAPKEPTQLLAAACLFPTTTQAPSCLQENGVELQAEVLEAVERALSKAKAAGIRWVVEAASCLVRAGVGLKSTELGRFNAGTVLEQLEQQGSRLRVRKIEGDGPDDGWVSYVVSGRTVLRAVDT